MKWDALSDTMLKKYTLKDGKSFAEVAKLMSVSHQTVTKAASRLGIAPRPSQDYIRIRRSKKSRPLPVSKNSGPGLISFEELKGNSCRWPTGSRAPFKFCGCTVEPNARWPYCPTHLEKASGRYAEPESSHEPQGRLLADLHKLRKSPKA